MTFQIPRCKGFKVGIFRISPILHTKSKTDQKAKTRKVTCPVKFLNLYLAAFNISQYSDEFNFQESIIP